MADRPYRVATVATNHLEDYLNDLDAEGWEIVSVSPVPNTISSWTIVVRGKSWRNH